jgi:arylsulfatase A-like enzyme
MAAWFGLVTGLVEGVVFYTFRELNLFTWQVYGIGAGCGPEVIGITTVFGLLLFLAAGLVLSVCAWFAPRMPVMRLAVGLFGLLMFFDWSRLLLCNRARTLAIAILAVGLTVVLMRWLFRRTDAVQVFCRRTLPWVAAVAVLAVGGIPLGSWLWEKAAVAQLPAAKPNSPNLLVIVIDTLRADHLSSYGYARPTSPNLDRVAREGVLLANALAASSWTTPSHASLLTGRPVHEHGADAAHLDGRYPTLAEAMLAQGYRTAAFSANQFCFTRAQGFGRGFIRFEDELYTAKNMAALTVYGRTLVDFVLRPLGYRNFTTRKHAPDINSAMLRWLDQDQQRPFFVVLNYIDTHDAYCPPPPYNQRFSDGPPDDDLPSPASDLSREEWKKQIAAYDAAITYVDEYIGRLFDELRDRGLAKDTLIMITSDHGDMFGEHGLWLHGNGLYRGVTHVPLIIRWPGHVPENVRIERPVSNAAVPATSLDLLGMENPARFPGPSLARLWQTPAAAADWPNPVAEIVHKPFCSEEWPCHDGAMKALMTPRWHLIANEKRGLELYDWNRDPDEEHDLTGRPEMQAELKRLQAELDGICPRWP